MFERVRRAGRGEVTIFIDGRPVAVQEGDSVAAALLAAGVVAFRANAANGDLRGPYCLMGACQECLVTIDGQPGMQSCAVPVVDGMLIDLGGTSTGDADG